MRKNRRIYTASRREAAPVREAVDQGWRDEVRLGQRRAKRVQRMIGIAVQSAGWLWLVWFMYPFYDDAATFAKGLGIAGLVLVFVAMLVSYMWDKLEESQEV